MYNPHIEGYQFVNKQVYVLRHLNVSANNVVVDT